MFHCQKCANPIKLDDSLLNLNTVQVNLLKDKRGRRLTDTQDDEEEDDPDPSQFITQDKIDLINSINDQTPIIYNNDLEDHHDNNLSLSTSMTSNSFVFVSDGELIDDKHDDDHGLISNRLRTLNKVFEILSSNNDIDHPLCQDCCNLLIDNYKLKFDQSQKEKDYYLNFLKKLRDQNEVHDNDNDDKLGKVLKEYENLKNQQEEKLEALKVLEDTKVKLDEQLNKLKQEFEESKNNDLDSILTLRNDLSLDFSTNMNKLTQVNNQYQQKLNHLDNLRNFNIYNEFFKISCDEKNKFGTINGFRLGYKVPWSEVNSGLGQIVLLLLFLIKRLQFKLVNYKLIPMGSQSQIIKISQVEDDKAKTVLNLYSSNEFSVGKLFNFNKFDVSMIALLDIISQIQQKIKLIDDELELPYKISSKKDTIGGKSIRVTSNSEWTDSCKFLLTNLNWMLAYTSVHTDSTSV